MGGAVVEVGKESTEDTGPEVAKGRDIGRDREVVNDIGIDGDMMIGKIEMRDDQEAAVLMPGKGDIAVGVLIGIEDETKERTEGALLIGHGGADHQI